MKDVIVIKIGGVAAQKLSTKFIKQMQAWVAAGKKIVVVHGGGLVINQLMKERQLPTRKVKGLRVTAKSDLPIIEQALLGQVGRTLTQELKAFSWFHIWERQFRQILSIKTSMAMSVR